MATSKLPTKLYVTGKKQPKYDNGKIISYDTPLGFLNAYEPGKAAFEKKRITQEEWAYKDYIQNFKLERRGPEFWITGLRWGNWLPGVHNRAQEQVCEFAEPQPQVWDNTPMAGFKIENSVSRYSTSNKLWRISDPRGFEFEITTGVLEQIIEDATILKGGIIDAKCAWMSNKNLVVVA